MPVAQHNAWRRRGSAYHAAAAARFSASNNSAKLWQWCWLGLASQLVFPPTGQKNLNFPPHALRKCCCITASWQASAAAAIMLRCSATAPPPCRRAAASAWHYLWTSQSHTNKKPRDFHQLRYVCTHTAWKTGSFVKTAAMIHIFTSKLAFGTANVSYLLQLESWVLYLST